MSVLTRARVITALGIVLVPLVAYRIPYLSGFMSVLIAAVLAIALVWVKPGSPRVELGLTRPRSIGRALAIGIVFGVALFLFNRLLLTPGIEHLTGIHRDVSWFDYLRGNWRALLALLPMVWFSAGLCEEVIYRGYLITQTSRLLGNSHFARVAALVIAAYIFALSHWYQGLTGMLVTLVLAIAFGLLFFQQRENLWANVVAHITADTVSFAAITTNWDHWFDHLGRSLFFRT